MPLNDIIYIIVRVPAIYNSEYSVRTQFVLSSYSGLQSVQYIKHSNIVCIPLVEL